MNHDKMNNKKIDKYMQEYLSKDSMCEEGTSENSFMVNFDISYPNGKIENHICGCESDIFCGEKESRDFKNNRESLDKYFNNFRNMNEIHSDNYCKIYEWDCSCDSEDYQCEGKWDNCQEEIDSTSMGKFYHSKKCDGYNDKMNHKFKDDCDNRCDGKKKHKDDCDDRYYDKMNYKYKYDCSDRCDGKKKHKDDCYDRYYDKMNYKFKDDCSDRCDDKKKHKDDCDDRYYDKMNYKYKDDCSDRCDDKKKHKDDCDDRYYDKMNYKFKDDCDNRCDDKKKHKDDCDDRYYDKMNYKYKDDCDNRCDDKKKHKDDCNNECYNNFIDMYKNNFNECHDKEKENKHDKKMRYDDCCEDSKCSDSYIDHFNKNCESSFAGMFKNSFYDNNVNKKHKDKKEVKGNITVYSTLECVEGTRIKGVKVNLYRINGISPQLVASCNTDSNGKVEFINVPEGSYRVIQLIDKKYFNKPCYINWNEVTIDCYNQDFVVYAVNTLICKSSRKK